MKKKKKLGRPTTTNKQNKTGQKHTNKNNNN